MGWLWMNIVPALLAWGAMTGIPLWMVFKRPDRAASDPLVVPAQKRPVWPADRQLTAERELALAHSELARAHRDPVPVRVAVAASR